MDMKPEKKMFSICIPVYNNAGNLPITMEYIFDKMCLFDAYDLEIIMVNDGSSDNSYDVMKRYQKQYPELIKIASFTRNFGQGACTHACYEMAKGDVIGVISADGQDPFELFADMLKEWENGYKVVLATRDGRKDKGIVVGFSKLFHKMIHKLNSDYPIGGFDFVLMDKEVVEKYLSIDQVDSMGQLKLLWLGYKNKVLHYTRNERNNGKSGYKIFKKIGLASNTLIYESAFPIHVITVGGIIVFSFAILLILIGLILNMCGVWNTSFGHYIIPTIMAGVGMNLMAIGVVGEYIWNQFRYIKGLPRYVMEEKDEREK